ncbi:MAG: hypothetical protein D3916_18410, partial [Candidatus Electrothrix sp. MAN1_4]|nr:hypothetical protein [Candidatus Electrothrix sp. MAN1_4]
ELKNMTKRTLRERLTRFAMAVAIGGSAFQLSGCDPTVRDALLTGLETTTQSLSSTIISAFFLSLDDESDTSGLTTT